MGEVGSEVEVTPVMIEAAYFAFCMEMETVEGSANELREGMRCALLAGLAKLHRTDRPAA